MRLLCLLFWLCSSSLCHGDLAVIDDSGHILRLNQPARRIVSLAPHLTEILYAAGAGSRIIATVEFSDYPPEARALPRIGSYERIDLESLLRLKPDLVIAWRSGTPTAVIEKIRSLGLPLYLHHATRIEDVARDLERFGDLSGQKKTGAAAAENFRRQLAQLRHRHAKKPRIRVFYEVWNSPLMTVGGPQVITDVIHLCGGENIFSDLPRLAPVVSLEAVLAAQPEAIVAAGMGNARPEWLDDWKKWASLPAVAQGNLFHIHPDLMHRHSPRLLEGADRLCQLLELARQSCKH